MYTDCRMIAINVVMRTLHIYENDECSLMRTLRIYSLSNFQVYNTVAVTIVTMLYITFPELTYLVTGSLYLLITCTHFPHPNPSPLAATNLFFVSISSFFLLDFTYN